MNDIILSIPSKTIRLVASQLAIPVFYESNGTGIPSDIGLLIRWGNTQKIDEDTFKRELNTREAIILSSNKKLARQRFNEANVPVPMASENAFPVIGRRTHHTQGSNFFFCRNTSDVNNAKKYGCTYFSQYYPKTKEYRIHIGSGKVLVFSEKYGDTSKFIWNKKKNKFTFTHIKRSLWLHDAKLMKIQKLAKKAIEVVGLDFGCVDIMADPKDRSLPEMVVSEINSAPSLSPFPILKYTQYFNKERG